jgi:hypothetical protein
VVKVNVDFWHVFDSNGDPVEAYGLLAPLKRTSSKRRLRRRDSEHSDYIEILSDRNNQVFGRVSRVRMSGFPGRFNLTTAKREELEIEEDEGIDEVGYFLYDAALQAMVTQRHRLVRPSTIEDLVSEITGCPIGLSPVLRKDKWARFEKMEKLGSFTLRLRGPAHHPDFSGVMESMSALLAQSQTDVNAQTFELTLGAGRGKEDSLNPSLLKKLMTRIRAKDDNIESLKVRGREEGRTRQEEIDFIRDRLVFSSNAEYEGRVLRVEECQEILRRAIEAHRDYLQSLL